MPLSEPGFIGLLGLNAEQISPLNLPKGRV